MNAIQKLTALLLIGLTFATPAMAAYTANYTVSDMDDIIIDVVATGAVEVKGEIPTLVDLSVLYIILALLLAIVAMAIGVFLVAPELVKRKMGRRRT